MAAQSESGYSVLDLTDHHDSQNSRTLLEQNVTEEPDSTPHEGPPSKMPKLDDPQEAFPVEPNDASKSTDEAKHFLVIDS